MNSSIEGVILLGLANAKPGNGKHLADYGKNEFTKKLPVTPNHTKAAQTFSGSNIEAEGSLLARMHPMLSVLNR